jgi:hypothetical protein
MLLFQLVVVVEVSDQRASEKRRSSIRSQRRGVATTVPSRSESVSEVAPRLDAGSPVRMS